jgi:hypothetical protein
MSLTLVTDLLSQVSVRLGDPRMTRTTQADLLAFYNEALEELTLGWKVLEEDATADIQATERRYLYPEECVQLRRARYNATPLVEDAGWNLVEDFWEEHKARTNYFNETGEPRHYCVRASFFELRPTPDTNVSDGLFVSYWKLGTPVVISDLLTATVELPAAFRKYLREYTAVYAKEKSGRYQEAAADRATLTEELDRVAGRLEDKSDDRRSQMRVRPVRARFGRQN